MNENSSAGEILCALGFAAFQRNPDGRFTPIGKLPEWGRRFPQLVSVSLSRKELTDVFPFLDMFLSDAEEFWGFSQSVLLDSGPWTQPDASGATCTLRASTISASNRPYLLLSLAGAQFEESRAIIQRARDQSLAYRRMERRLRELESRSRESEDLNGPNSELHMHVNAIIRVSTILAEGQAGNLTDTQKGFVGEIGEAAGRLLALLNGVRDLPTADAGRSE